MSGNLRSLADVGTLRRMVHNLQEGIYITDRDGVILDANPAFLTMIGVSSVEELRTLTSSSLIADPQARLRELETLDREGTVKEFELELHCADGATRTVIDTAYKVLDPDTGDTLYHGILVDISERKELERRLREAAIRDPLTGCYNRRYLNELEKRLECPGEAWGTVAIDVDHLKQFNDMFGHHAGDQVLLRIARFLMRNTRAEDAVIRMGGDEFLLILAGSRSETTREVAERLAESGPGSAPVSFTLGWAVRQGNETLEATIRRADRELILIRVNQRHPDGRLSWDPDAE